ncbi:hypothetical protein RRG08_039369 [Elysia crispata]|uniref:Uncharacterized protein n=1 Tax=Elysia crispata TaxID=231223 RepID=A0AAE0XV21_9GAST|nr:hypothetical protein RRG08_039369 [Elysia crispata]
MASYQIFHKISTYFTADLVKCRQEDSDTVSLAQARVVEIQRNLNHHCVRNIKLTGISSWQDELGYELSITCLGKDLHLLILLLLLPQVDYYLSLE